MALVLSSLQTIKAVAKTNKNKDRGRVQSARLLHVVLYRGILLSDLTVFMEVMVVCSCCDCMVSD